MTIIGLGRADARELATTIQMIYKSNGCQCIKGDTHRTVLCAYYKYMTK